MGDRKISIFLSPIFLSISGSGFRGGANDPSQKHPFLRDTADGGPSTLRLFMVIRPGWVRCQRPGREKRCSVVEVTVDPWELVSLLLQFDLALPAGGGRLGAQFVDAREEEGGGSVVGVKFEDALE